MDMLKRPVQVRTGLCVNGKHIRARLRVIVHEPVRLGHHQVNIKEHFRNRPDRTDHDITEGNRRHKLTVHHVNVKPWCSGVFQDAYLFAEFRKIRR